MHLDGILWILLPVFVAAGSALLSFYVMEARMEVAVARERESLAEARAIINSQKITMEERVKAAEESTRRQAMDEFMQEFRVEERSYARESRSLTASKKTVVMQERLYFRNIPLSNWIEREMVVEEGADLDQLRGDSVFTAAQTPVLETPEPAALATPTEDLLAMARFVAPAEEPRHEGRAFTPVVVPAFGAQ